MNQLQIRPKGVSILGWLHLIGGLLGVLFMAFFSMHPALKETTEGLREFGLAPWFVLLSILFLFTIGLGSGIGMLRGKKWGWYLGSFYYVYSVIRNVTALWTISALSTELEGELDSMNRGVEYYYAKHILRVLLHSAIYLYFFRSNVRVFFGTETIKMTSLILSQVGICLVIYLVANFLV